MAKITDFLELPSAELTDETLLYAVKLSGDRRLSIGALLTGTRATTAALQTAIDGKAATAHNHDGAAITTGTIDPARIPVLPSGKQVISSGDLTALTLAQQDEIGAGTLVVVVDGRRWIYSGSGVKTAEASYILSSDTTPEWTAIQNKPAFGGAALLEVGTTAGTVAAGAHTHAIGDTTGLQDALNARITQTAADLRYGQLATANTWAMPQTLGGGFADITGTGAQLRVAGTKVVGAQGAVILDADGTLADVNAKFNALLARLRAATGHGLIA